LTCSGTPGAFESEVDAPPCRAHGTHSAVTSARHRVEVERLDRVQLFVAGLGARQGQQLVDQVRGAVGALGDLLQQEAHLRRVGLGERHLGLRLEPGQRRAHLVRGVGDEALLRLQVFFQPQPIMSLKAWMTSGRTSSGTLHVTDRRQVGRAAAMDALLQQVAAAAMPRIRPNRPASRRAE
jgi:hypothetical protein